MANSIENKELDLAFEFVQYTHKNVFLTGNAGTGKTTFLHNLKTKTFKRMVVVAPTGVAAINAGGVTIHSFFQMPFSPNIPVDYSTDHDLFGETRTTRNKQSLFKFGSQKIKIIKSLDLLVIDEISMVRSDVLDGIDEVLRRYKDRTKPFGGVQLLMIGDMHQLAPVVKEDEWSILRKFYDTVYFYSSKALQQTSFISIELKHIYRQSDQTFIDLLNKVRNDKLDYEGIEKLNGRHIPGFERKEDDGYIILTTHNAKAKEINESKLAKLKSASYFYYADVEGDFPEYSFPTDGELELKEGAQVMFIKNDFSPEKLFFNGKIGTITGIEDDSIFVQCENEDFPIEVQKMEWENVKYELDNSTKELKENTVGVFRQYPLKLAWAITIHKSQGLTFDKAIIDAQAAFAYGQVYVALSRCRSLEGLVLSTPLNTQSIRIDGNIISFTRQMENNPPDSNLLTTEKRGFQEMLLVDLFNFAILVRRHYYFLKILRDNVSSVNPEVIDLVEEITKVLKEDIDSVSNKFKPQLRSLLTQSDNAENNPQLKERLSKAANWFEEKLRVSVWDQINSLEIETDNKEVKKSTKDQLTKIKEDTYVKLECFKACFNGFNTKHFLEVKAKASIDDHLQKKPKKITNEKAYAAGSNPELYETLKQWRNKTADKEDVSVYMVIQLKTMNAICNLLPSSYLELKAIKGFGKKKLDKYGKEIFDIVADFRKGQGLATGVWDVSEKENKPKKIDTKQQSFQLFKSGLTVEEVARERGMITRTIEGHLAHFVGTGELKISEFVDDKKVEIVSEYLEENPNSRLAEAKAALGDDYSYSELAFVVKHLEFLSR